MPTHTVRHGEFLSKIVRQYGYSDWVPVYEHSANTSFRALRPNPNRIQPGDQLFIPEIKARSHECNTEDVHYFCLKSPAIKLETDFPIRQLEYMVNKLQDNEILAWLITLFGADVPLSAYRSLLNAMKRSGVPRPKLQITQDEIDGHQAAYDQAHQTILISKRLIDEARSSDEGCAKLFVALLEEFGHHIDALLRHVWSSVGGNGPRDEGAAYAFSVIQFKLDLHPTLHFADVLDGTYRSKLILHYESLHSTVSTYLSKEHIEVDERGENIAFFAAGRGHGGSSFGHESIEDRLKDAGFNANERKVIYFGNWLRDYSQLCDPKIVTRPGTTDFTLSLPRKDWTEFVDILAEAKFGNTPTFRVDMDRLGVYLPREHIDNPNGLTSGKDKDPDFRGACQATELLIDTDTLLKRYIQDSKDYIAQQLTQAVFSGKKEEGLRHFGQALHTLEDFFAHSNFAELTLRKHGYPVFPWTAQTRMSNGTYQFPIVTGSYGGLDTAASILLGIGEQLTKIEPFEPGKRTTAQKLGLIILRRFYPEQAKQLDAALKSYEQLQPDYPLFAKASYYTVAHLARTFNLLLGTFIQLIGNTLDEAESIFINTPGSSDPTHTQLAKDHDDHPLHALAAWMAQESVFTVGNALQAAWRGKKTVQEVVNSANAFIVHPTRTTWMDQYVLNWCKSNKSILKTLEQPHHIFDLIQQEKAKISHRAEQLTNAYLKLEEDLREIFDSIWKQF